MGNYQNAAPCPSCGQSNADKIGFTWWGGAVGPAILNHVKCLACGTEYNAKSGQSNTTGIIIYSVVAIVIVLVAVYFINTM
jgi:hypothetical protein